MGLLETLAFIFSSHVRKEIGRYEFFPEERRNPRILAPQILQQLKIDDIMDALKRPYLHLATASDKLRARVQEIV